MADFMWVTRTNYFRVTDEEKYDELFEMLTGEDTIEDFTETTGTGADEIIRHSFGCYGAVEYYNTENDEYDLDIWLGKLQEILPDDEAFILESSGNDCLQAVVSFVIVVTRKEISRMSCDEWAKKKAKELLGQNFKTKTRY